MCRLPYTDFAETGFIGYPGGAFVADPGSAIVADPARPGGGVTAAQPKLYGRIGNGQETYDWAQSRWLPVDAELVSPGGTQYAYAEPIPNPGAQGMGGPPPLGTKVHLVDVATATDTVIYQTQAVEDVAAFGPDGIYLTEPVSLADTVTPFYLWRLDPMTHSAHQILGGRSIGPGTFVIAGAEMWIMAIDPSNPKGPATLLRVDLNSGGETIWQKQTTTFAQFDGVDSNANPIVSTSSGAPGDAGETSVVTAPGSPELIANQQFGQALADSHGLWLNGNGIWLDAGHIIKEVSSESTGRMLGPCG